MPNRLSLSTSPYLLQHSLNPVNWQPWDEETLRSAKAEQKPVFLSIGYAACHWCHVMAHESFSDPETAALLNENFISVKVDREERPDLDAIYMKAAIAATGAGGWPLSVFLTPELKPFFAGTYFPPVRRYGMPSFRDVLTTIASAWQQKRGEIEAAAEEIAAHLHQTAESPEQDLPSTETLNIASEDLRESYDWRFGGWGDAPRFPQAMALEFLLHNDSANKTADNSPLVEHCLLAMAQGGMYDVVGGGFSRYSTDNRWHVPHFEKMLTDNALLMRLYLHGWQIFQNPVFLQIVRETLAFVSREMTSPAGGFYSSLDADSDGGEGKFYLWTYTEISRLLGDDAQLFIAAYGVTGQGNREGGNILRRELDDNTLAVRFGISPEESGNILAHCRLKLLAARRQRIRPGTDDKIITSWNGLMLAAVAEAARVLEEPELPGIAVRNAEFLLTQLRPDGKLRRAWREGRTTAEVFLEDYAALILGLIELYQTDFDERWLNAAGELTGELIETFSDPAGGFFDAPGGAAPLLLRPRELPDNAIPSGNSLAAEALLKMAALTGRREYRDYAERTLRRGAALMTAYPLGFGRRLAATQLAAQPLAQVAIVGDLHGQTARQMLAAIRAGYRPGLITAASSLPLSKTAPAVFTNRGMEEGKTTAYLCAGTLCRRPVTDPGTLSDLLDSL